MTRRNWTPVFQVKNRSKSCTKLVVKNLVILGHRRGRDRGDMTWRASQLGDLHQSSQRRIPLFSEAKSESMLKHSDFWSAEIRHSLSVEPARQLREARAKIRLFGVLNLYDNLCIVSRLLKTQTGKLYTNRHTNSLAKVASAESLCFQRQISPLSGLLSRAD